MTDVSEAELTLAERVDDVPRALRALRRAVRQALWEHKVAGNPVAVWRNGRVEWIPPEEIPSRSPLGTKSPKRAEPELAALYTVSMNQKLVGRAMELKEVPGTCGGPDPNCHAVRR